MKAGWRTSLLADVLIKTETANPQLAPAKKFRYVDVSRVSNQTFQIEATQELLGKDAPSRARKVIKSNDILFATIRPTLQRIAIVPDELNGEVCSTGYFVLRPCADVNHRFLFYFLFTDSFSGEMAKLQKGASYPAVTDGEVRNQKISYPAVGEQQRIVAILDEAFDGIATTKANAEKNLRNANHLFGSYLQSVFGQNEEQVELSQVTTDISDGDHSPPPKSTSGVPFITISNIDKATRRINFDDTFTVSAEYFAKLKPNRKPRRGDVLYTVTGSLGIPVLVDHDSEFCFQRHIGLVRPNASTDSRWLNYALLSPHVLAQANSRATGTAQKTVSLSVLRSILVPKVVLKTQRIVASRLAELEFETQRLESLYQQKLTALAELKKSLLHEAFSGRL